MNGMTLAGVMMLYTLCFLLACNQIGDKTGTRDSKAVNEGRAADRDAIGVLYRGHLPSRSAVDAVPWTRPSTRDGYNTIILDGPVGEVEIWFEEGEHLEVTAQTISFLQLNGELAQIDVALVMMDKEEAADALDRLATPWGMDKARLISWREAGKPDFPTTGFFLERLTLFISQVLKSVRHSMTKAIYCSF